MNRRAREILTSIAAAGIGGAIGSLVGRRPPRGRYKPIPRNHARGAYDAVPDAELDVMDTSPIYEAFEIIESDVDESLLDARPEGVGDGQIDNAPRADEQSRVGDDRDDGENWIEDLLENTSNDLPAERPLAIQADMDQKLTSLDDTRPRRRH